jgi:hypothetical protein
MTIFDQLNPINDTIIPPIDKHDVQIEEEDNLFGVGASILRTFLKHLLMHNSFILKAI